MSVHPHVRLLPRKSSAQTELFPSSAAFRSHSRRRRGGFAKPAGAMLIRRTDLPSAQTLSRLRPFLPIFFNQTASPVTHMHSPLAAIG